MKLSKNVDFWSASVIILVTVYLMVATYFRWFQLNFFVGSFRFTHWLGLIGTLFIAFFTPIYYVLKRRHLKRLKAIVRIHVFGNLFSFMLISIHFAQQIGRPPQSFPDIGTGLALYIIMLLLTATGFMNRFQIIRSVRPSLIRSMHVSITMSFYIIIGIHILHGLNIL